MAGYLDRLKQDLEKLIKTGEDMRLDLLFQSEEMFARFQEVIEQEKLKETAVAVKNSFDSEYQNWYSQALHVIKQLLPDRLSEFIVLYQGDGKRNRIDELTFTIQDWQNGSRASTLGGRKTFNDLQKVTSSLNTQINILASARSRFESSLFEIEQLARADLFDSELDSARELLRQGFLRPSGAIAGVVIEKHLSQVCANHNLSSRKKNPTISDLNDLLKNENVLDTPTWRQIQRLGDIRNLCVHNKEREPTSEEINELINGVDKFVKTLF